LDLPSAPETADAGIVFQPDGGIKQVKSLNLRAREDAPRIPIDRKADYVNAAR